MYTDQENKKKYLNLTRSIIISFLLGLGTFYSLVTTFSLSWSLNEFYKGSFFGGLINVWNEIGDTLGKTSVIFLEKLESGDKEVGLFLTLMLILLVGISWLILKSKNRYLLLLYLIPVILPSLIFKVYPSNTSVAIWLMGVAMALIEMDKSLQYGKDDGVKIWNITFVLGIVLSVIILLQVPLTYFNYNKPQIIEEINKKTRETTKEIYFGENPLKEGDLSQNKREGKDSKEGEKTALEVTMENPDSLYLRGFVGDIYGENKWSSLDSEIYYNNRDLIYWLNKGGFTGIGQIGYVENKIIKNKKVKADENLKKNNKKNIENKNEIDIKVKKANKEYGYIPYEIKEEKIKKGKIIGDNYLVSKKFKRLENYSYESEKNSVDHWTDIGGKLFTMERNKKYKDYMIKESHYNTYLYENYTFISNEDGELLKKYFGNEGNQKKGHIEYKTAIGKIRKYLDENYVYTENIGEKNKDNEPNYLKKFFESKKGYDVHFATAATMMFRYYGIPARYVEGYLITPEDVKDKTKNDLIKIPRKNHHSWTEIYVDGVGFIPIEVSPSYKGIMKEANLHIGIGNSTVTSSFVDENKENKKDSQLKKKNKVEEKSLKVSLIFLLTIIILILLFLVILYLLIKLIKFTIRKYKRWKFFNKEEPKIAVCAIYNFMEEKGLNISENIRDLGNKAAYSKKEIKEKERTWMVEQLKNKKKERKNEDKKNKRKKS